MYSRYCTLPDSFNWLINRAPSSLGLQLGFFRCINTYVHRSLTPCIYYDCTCIHRVCCFTICLYNGLNTTNIHGGWCYWLLTHREMHERYFSFAKFSSFIVTSSSHTWSQPLQRKEREGARGREKEWEGGRRSEREREGARGRERRSKREGGICLKHFHVLPQSTVFNTVLLYMYAVPQSCRVS